MSPPPATVAAPVDAAADFARRLREHEAVLRGLALRLCGSRADAGDLVQDTYEKALRRRAQYEPGTNLQAWLCTILHHLFIDRCRARSRGPAHAPLEEVVLPAPEPASEPAWAALTRDDVVAAVARLEPDFRRVYELHTLEGVPYQEIAARLGIPKATVGTRLARARRKLRDLLLPARGADESHP
jgi:RNA polymerase sigma-70 factor (ECF subfamily)